MPDLDWEKGGGNAYYTPTIIGELYYFTKLFTSTPVRSICQLPTAANPAPNETFHRERIIPR